MDRRKRLAWAELKVGILIVIALILLVLFVFQAAWGGRLLTFGRTHFYARTYLPSVERLKPGAPVWLTGLEIGKVLEINPVSYREKDVYVKNEAVLKEIHTLKREMEALDPTQRDYQKKRADLGDRIRDKKTDLRTVAVLMKIDNKFQDRIGVDSEVNIGSQGLIAESYIDISVGSFGEPPRKEWDPKLNENVVLIEGVKTPGFREILTGANDVIANFGVLSDKAKTMINQIDVENIGKTVGGIGTGLDESLKNARTAFAEATKLVQDIRTGEGSLAKVINDPELYNTLNRSMKNFDDVTTKIKEGEGSFAKFINDPSLYDALDEVFGRLERGEGALGKFSKDEALYDSTKVTLDKFADLMQRLDRGEGTAGKFFRDPALYQNSNQTLVEAKQLIQDVRRQPRKFLKLNFNMFKFF